MLNFVQFPRFMILYNHLFFFKLYFKNCLESDTFVIKENIVTVQFKGQFSTWTLPLIKKIRLCY